MTPRDALIAARVLIEKPEHFTQGAYARTADGLSTECTDPNAVAFCAAGALEKIVRLIPGDISFHVIDALDAVAHAVYPMKVGSFRGKGLLYVNDTLGHVATLAMFDEAIRRAA